jgi:hypothetical protein
MASFYGNCSRLVVIILSFSTFFKVSLSTSYAIGILGIPSSDLVYLRTAIQRKNSRDCRSENSVLKEVSDSNHGSARAGLQEVNKMAKFIARCRGGAVQDSDDSDDDNSDEGSVDDDDEEEEEEDDSDLVNEGDEDSNTVDDKDEESETNDATDDDKFESAVDDEVDDNDEDSDVDEDMAKPQKKKYDTKRKATMFETSVGSLTTAAAAAFKLTKGGVKVAVDLVSAKHVSLNQFVGKWRMEQEVQISKGASITCPASLEFTEDGRVITSFEGKVQTSEFKFIERPWPRKCTIQFEAAAFQGPSDKEPVSMFYRGHFKKSILNPNVVLIRGKVYKLTGSMFWKKQKKCGTFKATMKRYR